MNISWRTIWRKHSKRTALSSSGRSLIFDETRDQMGRDGFDVAILDINLHDEPAYPIADELMLRDIPFAFCTGYDKEMIPERFAHVRQWQKPYDPQNSFEDALSRQSGTDQWRLR